MDSNEQWIERSAKLFEAGAYPDKGVEFGADDLNRLAEKFCEPVPILIEHATSPLELGRLTQVWVEGHELFGTVQLSPEANALIERSNAKSLSIGLSAEMDLIEEVSLVQAPRVSTARLFSGRLGEEVDWRSRFMALRRQHRSDGATVRLRQWIESGKLLPSQSEVARSLLECSAKVVFDGESTPVAQLVTQLLDLNGSHGLFREQVPHRQAPGVGMTPDETDFYQRHFPSLELAEIARHRGER